MSKPSEGDRVSIRAGTYDDDPWVDAEVDALLSVQFTCWTTGKGSRLLFGFYSDEGTTWKKLS